MLVKRMNKSLSPVKRSKEASAEAALAQCARKVFPPISNPPLSANPSHTIADALDSIKCDDLKTLGGCLTKYLQHQQYYPVPKLELVRNLVCNGLAGDEKDAATIGAFVIRMLSCTTNGLCQDLKEDALGDAFDKMVGRDLTGQGDCLITKKSEMKVVIVFVICILFFTFIGYMLGKKAVPTM